MLVGDSGQGLVARATIVKGSAAISNQPVQNALAWQAVQTARPVAGQPQQESATGRSVIPVFVPMIVGNTSFGVLSAMMITEVVTEEQFNLLESLVDYAAIGFKRARLALLTSS